MKFIKFSEDYREHKKGTVPHYTFNVGPQEIVILRDCLDYIYKIIPKSVFTQPFTSRLNAMRLELHRVSKDYDLKFKRPPMGNPNDQTEVF